MSDPTKGEILLAGALLMIHYDLKALDPDITVRADRDSHFKADDMAKKISHYLSQLINQRKE